MISAELTEISSYTYPKIALLQQSGERLIVDALVTDSKHSADTTEQKLFTNAFTFAVPKLTRDQRICIDIANVHTGFRRLSLMKLLEPVGKVSARIEALTEADAATFISAYPTASDEDDPQRACLSSSGWIYPIRIAGAAAHGDVVLKLRINTGGSDAKIAEIDDRDVAFGSGALCPRDEDGSGLFDRQCTLVATSGKPIVRFQIVVAQRNAGSKRKKFSASVGEQQ